MILLHLKHQNNPIFIRNENKTLAHTNIENDDSDPQENTIRKWKSTKPFTTHPHIHQSSETNNKKKSTETWILIAAVVCCRNPCRRFLSIRVCSSSTCRSRSFELRPPKSTLFLDESPEKNILRSKPTKKKEKNQHNRQETLDKWGKTKIKIKPESFGTISSHLQERDQGSLRMGKRD